MTKETFVSWAELSKTISIPLLIVVLGWNASKLSGIESTMVQLQVKVAQLETTVKIHNEEAVRGK